MPRQYKDVILGLVFLKYVSDAFDERRDADPSGTGRRGLDEEQIGELHRRPRTSTPGHGVFWVPEQARWAYLAENAKGRPAMDGEAAKTIGAAHRRRHGRRHGRQPDPRRHPAAASTTATTSTSAASAS